MFTQQTQEKNCDNSSIFGNLIIPNGAKIRGNKPLKADSSLCLPSEKNKNIPLFEHVPCVDDIQQTSFGDCYLLSALISLINCPKYGPQFITNMMKDNMDGTVTVRFFKFDIDPSDHQSPKNIRPVYCTVKKGEVPENQNSALWVQTIENAYARCGLNLYPLKYSYLLSEDDNEKNKIFSQLNKVRTLNDIDSGIVNFAIFSLTSEMSEFVYSCENDQKKYIPAYIIKNIYEKNYFSIISFKKDTDVILSGHTYSIYDVFEKDEETYITIINPWNVQYSFNDFKTNHTLNYKDQTIQNKVITLLIDDKFIDNISRISGMKEPLSEDKTGDTPYVDENKIENSKRASIKNRRNRSRPKK